MSLLTPPPHLVNGAQIIKDWLGDGAQIVEQETAQNRANVCLACPLNQPGNPLVGVAAFAIKQIIGLKSKMFLKVNGERSLLTCSACDCQNRLKVWMPRDRILSVTSEETFAKLDKDCWVRHETT